MDAAANAQVAAAGVPEIPERSPGAWEAYKEKWRARVADPRSYPIALLAVTALFLNSDQNLMAPNLTRAAIFFNFTDEERDRKLGGDIALGIWLVGGFSALFAGYFTDTANRKNLFGVFVMLGEIACFLTYWVVTYQQLFWARALTGISFGASLPLIWSMVGDMYTDEERGKAVSAISIMMALGIGVGQMIAGLIGPTFGWKSPFLVTSVPAMFFTIVFVFTTKEPERGRSDVREQQQRDESGGSKERRDSIADMVSYEEKFDWEKFKFVMSTPTALLTFLQGLPGSVPWGAMFVFWQDWLVFDKAEGTITTEQSTLILLIFGAGSAIGTIYGGIWADKLWNIGYYKSVAYMMSFTTMFGFIPMLIITFAPVMPLGVYCVLLFPTGFLVTITGTALKTVLLNVTLPETRGTAFSVYTLADDLGKALGPFWVSLLIAAAGSRTNGMAISMGGWVICGLILFCMSFTIERDYIRTQAALDKVRETRRGGDKLAV